MKTQGIPQDAAGAGPGLYTGDELGGWCRGFMAGLMFLPLGLAAHWRSAQVTSSPQPAPERAFVFTQGALWRADGTLLGGMVTPNGPHTICWFEWGTTTNYDTRSGPLEIANSRYVQRVETVVGGLQAGVAYHYRLVVSNSAGAHYGADQVLGIGRHVAAWGSSTFGETVVPSSATNTVAVAAGAGHCLALQQDGSVIAWGNDSDGQSRPPSGLGFVTGIGAGAYHSLAIDGAGRVIAWGWNAYGQTTVPMDLTNIIAVAGGRVHSVALRRDGQLVAWGDNRFGQATVPEGLSNVVAIAAGSYHCLALRHDGRVVSWGWDNSGQATVPVNLRDAVTLSAGNRHSCALREDGRVVAWGDNSLGQSSVPLIPDPVVAISAGVGHTLALTGTGEVLAWGNSAQTQVPFLPYVCAITAGCYHNLAVSIHPPMLPEVVTETPSETTPHSTLLHASFNPRALSGWLFFEYGTPGGPARQTGTIQFSGETVAQAALQISGLTPATTYFCRAAGMNGLGAVQGNEVRFVTPVPAPRLLLPQTDRERLFEVSFVGETNARYTVWVSTNLSDWTSLDPNPGAGPETGFTDPDWTNFSRRFYRLSWP